MKDVGSVAAAGRRAVDETRAADSGYGVGTT
jgi:hypothetical protein